MFFFKSFMLSLCLIISTSLDLGEECFDSTSAAKGRCQEYDKCNYNGKEYVKSCGGFEDQICCPAPFEGAECVDSSTTVDGRCQNYRECNYVLKYRKIPRYCDASLVCCPSVELRISEKMCFNYIHHNNYSMNFERTAPTPSYDYENAEPFYDSTESTETDYDDNVPFVDTKDLMSKTNYLAVIGFIDVDDDIIIWNCGGSIMSPLFILSAAHCAKDRQLGSAKWVRIGDLHSLNGTKDANDFQILKVFIHPDYSSSSIYNDIALFKLKKEIIFGDDYQPACLHAAKNVPENMKAIRWSQHGSSNAPSIYIQGYVQVIEYEICEAKYRSNPKFPKGLIDELQICVWSTFEYKLPCLDDFGGILFYKVRGFGDVREHYVVAGILSFQDNCDKFSISGVFTRISPYLDWIEEIVWEDETEPETVTFVFTN